MPSITVVGAGAVGSYYGALLARDGNDLTLVARGPHLAALRERGAVAIQEADGSEWSAPIRATDRPRSPAEVVIVTTKSHDTREAAALAGGAMGPDTTLLSLQNGVENVGMLDSVFGAGRALGGIAFVGVWLSAPGVVVHQAEGWVRVGDPTGGLTTRAKSLHALLQPSWDVTLSSDITLELWRKLLWNIGFNALCAVTGATAGEALLVPESRALVREAMQEVVALARARGVDLQTEDVDEMAAFNEKLRDYQPSMARDMEAGKRVERAALSGYVVSEGVRCGVETPVNRVLDGLLVLQSKRRRGLLDRPAEPVSE